MLVAMRNFKPDLVLLDPSLRGTNGIELIKSMKAEQPQLPILVVSMHDEGIFGLRALKAGALGLRDESRGDGSSCRGLLRSSRTRSM
jgi:DNA-binding NarL/FixJ family response regulator